MSPSSAMMRRRPRSCTRCTRLATAIALYVLYNMQQIELRWPTFDASSVEEDGDGSSVRAPIIGRVAKVFVREGDSVAKGDRIAVVEAMKMEHVLHAARAGRIAKLAVKEGQQVTQGALIAALATSASRGSSPGSTSQIAPTLRIAGSRGQDPG